MSTIHKKAKIAYRFASGYLVEKALNPIQYNGIKIDANCGALKTIHKARFFPYYKDNEHSIREKTLVDRYLPENKPVIEFGGGIGYISSYVNKNLEDGVTQVVVEPNPQNISCNKRTKNLNNCDYNLVEGAYSADNSSVEFSISPKFSMGSADRNMSDNQINAEGFSLSYIYQEYDLENFVLISDMEGGEFRLIGEEIEIISELVPLAIIEIHPFGKYNEEEYVNRLVSAGFEELDEISHTYAFKNTNFES